jgi:hypothetical protein
MRYVDLMDGNKPHLLVKIVNNMGAETHVHYVPSTRFYLQDKQASKPWLTRLPFPVHVVDRVETFDRISRNHFTTRYAYHHGHFDGLEREFRGFGMVEQWDTEEFNAVRLPDGPAPHNFDAASHVPPVLTKTWIHAGLSHIDGILSKQFEHEYYHEPGLTDAQLHAMMLEDTAMPDHVRLEAGTLAPHTLSAQERHEASRSLKGSVLRQEVYVLDDTEAQNRPYKVTESNFTVELLQPVGPNKHAIFLTHPREVVDFDYERSLSVDASGHLAAEPRVTHNVVFAVDDYGNMLKSVAVSYGRRREESQPVAHR